MIYPSIDKITNLVASKYELVHVVARRSREMKKYDHYQLDEKSYKSCKNIGKTLEEIAEQMITVVHTK